MRPLYIFDLDGTIADQMHRRHLLDSGDWESYFDACTDDKPIAPVIETLEALIFAGADVWIFSGRSERVRKQTVSWLDKNFSWRFDNEHIVMRLVGDTRPDDVIKQEMLDRMLVDDRDRLVAVFDDRDRVVSMWRRNGVPCFQVAPGDF